jgi:hypothetical protein
MAGQAGFKVPRRFVKLYLVDRPLGYSCKLRSCFDILIYCSKPVRINELQKVLDAQALKTYHQLLDSPQGVLDLSPDAE